MSDDAPKSSYELALERLKKKDREDGVEDRPLTDEQKTAIADLKRVYEAKLAEREILHHSNLRKARDPETVVALDAEYAKDRERVANERDRRLEELRSKRS